MSKEFQYFKETDGGKKAAGLGRERATCTVTATAILFGIPWAEAHHKLALLGRRHGRGFVFSSAAAYFQLCLVPLPEKSTVGEALLKYRTGRYVFIVPKHAFAVIDGVAHDHTAPKLKQRVVSIFADHKTAHETC